jgi:capsular polysaccharide biosynthesis protein
LKKIKKKLQNIFKKVFYSLFKIFYGSVNGIISKKTEKLNISSVDLENQTYLIYEAKNARLYTDTIHDTAIIIDNKIVQGASFQLRDNKNVNIEENIVFKKGTPRIKKKINGRVLSLLTGGGGNSNYWHWLLDVLPRIFILSNYISVNKIDYFLFPDLKENFQKETLEILNISSKKCLSSRLYRHFSADEIIATDHPYNILNDPNKDSLNIPNWIILHLKKKFLLADKGKKKEFPKNFYIDRSDSKSEHSKMRSISNENDVMENLKNKGFSILRLSEFHFTDQVKLFNQAEYVVGLHGAGFANLAFCKPGTKVLELRSDTAGDLFKNFAVNNELNYDSIDVKPKSLIFNNQLGDIEINIEILNKKIFKSN